MLFNLVQGCTPMHDAVIGATLGYLSLWLINAIYQHGSSRELARVILSC
nr:conserved hypothetical protein [Serratia symbiotica]